MPGFKLLKPITLCAAFVVVAAPSPVSDPVGIYALIDRVVIEPDAANPRTIQIWGAFSLATGSGFTYQPAQRGYLYYTVNSRNERATLAEWSDLQKIAGTKEAIGFGGRYTPLGTLRQAKQPAENPDVYPLGFGLVKIATKSSTHQSAIIEGLQRVASEKTTR
ncbi:MAG: hypothetical protein ACREMA_15875 [Longimicrobiales bacterium]